MQKHGQITDKQAIKNAMHAHMLRPAEQKAPWIVAIFSREHRPGGWVYEGARVVSAVTDATGEVTYTVTIDGNTMPSLKLSQIEHITVL